MDVAHLAYICSENRLCTQDGLTQSDTLKNEIKSTLFSSLRTVRYLTKWLIKLSTQTQTKSYGVGDQKQNLQKKQRRS